MDGSLLAWLLLLGLAAATEGLLVKVPEKKKVAMLFEPALLRCDFSTSSNQPAVVQWRFKSYCQDRMGEALGMATSGLQAVSKRNLEWDPYLDCVDSRRTVRVVASKQGSAVTIGDFYKGRDVTIVHDADLQIGKLMWGDSGLYYCLIITPDDVEGNNEGSMELLVLEWVFVGLIIMGAFLFFLLIGICWCQCCPHSCCCYVRCPCCPDSCCCPRALYEAGKAAKAGYPSAVTSIPGPYYIPTVPVAGIPSPAVLMEKSHPPPLAPNDSSGGSQNVRKGYRIQADKERDSMKVLYYVEKELAQFDPARRMRERYNNTISELSSLHEEDLNFCQPYRQVRRKPLPPAGDLDGDAEYWAGVIGGGGTSRSQAVSDYREERDSFRHSQQKSKSEMLSRKSFSVGVPAVSMDELAAFAESYSQRTRRTDGQESRRFERSESRGGRGGAVQHQDTTSEEYYSKRRGNREPLTDSDRGWSYSPPRRRAHDEKHLPRLVSRTPGGSQKYDHSYLSSVLERKSRSYDESGEHSETPSKLSSQPSQRGGTYYAWSPPSTYKAGQQQQPPQQEEGEDTLPPYSERELSRGPSYRSRDQAYLNASDKKRKKEPKKTNDFPTRMSLVV
ncbi:immunoglobulin-like domain-containing receptor 2 isoform X2 [Alligator mississippiensis]|uniref:immunoglobulin-like domain-containing receptor 2 isoform X2 n=1 Tax=Alligator mississippiensis TaxID=8496 RepID=UPI0003D09931|nr:immunoglobulin-like domain-containing receptor 2 isoform X2 [Alligator mississippiensis]KYO22599.1 immunoglobulin-like domain-containing receptor 2 isoform B [Alligator mississippiensis]